MVRKSKQKKNIESTRVVIIGAGNVGRTIAFALMIQGIASEVVLIDVNKNKCEGEALDLAHGISFIKSVKVWCGDYKDCREADIVVICAGKSQKPKQSRLDLATINTRIVSNIAKKITHYTKDAIILVVTNPLDVMTYVAFKSSGLPSNQVFGSGTNLDSSRFRHIIAKKLDLADASIHAFLIGEHGDSAVPIFSHANIMGKSISGFPRYNLTAAKNTQKEVKNVTDKIIRKKGNTFYAIALSVCEIIRAILYNEKHVLLVSSFMSGKYGLNNVCLSLPSVIGRRGIERTLDIDLTADELDRLNKSAEIIQRVTKKIRRKI